MPESYNFNNNFVQSDLNIDEYLQKVITRNTETLSRDEELDLIKRIKNHNDKKAYTEFVDHNIRLVISCAHKFRSPNQRKRLTMEDLIQEGMFGLFKAIDGFDYHTGNRFSTYAANWIVQTMQHAIDDKGRTLRVRPSRLAIIKEYTHIKSQLKEKFNREPTFDEIAKHMPYTRATIRDCLELGYEPLSFSSKKSFNGKPSNRTLLDTIETEMSDDSNTADQELIAHEICQLVAKICTPQETLILTYMFGLDNKPKLTIDEIANKFNLSSEMVTVSEHHALQKLRSSHNFAQFKDLLS